MTTVESVRRNRGFLWLWGGQGISVFGEQFTALAIPVLAVTLLHAVAWQMGVLNAASTAAAIATGSAGTNTTASRACHWLIAIVQPAM